MKIIEKYIINEYLRNLLLTILIFLSLFEIVDIFDRLDNILSADSDFLTTIKYFTFKLPVILNLLIPFAALISTLFTLGLLSKNSEITAMRAGGISIIKIAKPIITCSLYLCLFSLFLNEKISPYFNRKIKEIYNIDIQKKDEKGTYNQSDFWWREGNNFLSTKKFDSKDNKLISFNRFIVDDKFKPIIRNSTKYGVYLGDNYNWRFFDVIRYKFYEKKDMNISYLNSQPIILDLSPKDLYSFNNDPYSMSFSELNNFIKEQNKNKISASEFLADLYDKTAFPFITLIMTIIIIPFSITSNRSGNLTRSAIYGAIIAFSYYFIHSTSLALGRAEIIPAMLSAWTANILLGVSGIVLLLSAESNE